MTKPVCPHCGKSNKPCSNVNSLAKSWARQACANKHGYRKDESNGLQSDGLSLLCEGEDGLDNGQGTSN